MHKNRCTYRGRRPGILLGEGPLERDKSTPLKVSNSLPLIPLQRFPRPDPTSGSHTVNGSWYGPNITKLNGQLCCAANSLGMCLWSPDSPRLVRSLPLRRPNIRSGESVSMSWLLMRRHALRLPTDLRRSSYPRPATAAPARSVSLYLRVSRNHAFGAKVEERKRPRTRRLEPPCRKE